MSIFHGSDAARSCRWVLLLMKSWQCWDASSISFRAWYIIQSVDDIASNLYFCWVFVCIILLQVWFNVLTFRCYGRVFQMPGMMSPKWLIVLGDVNPSTSCVWWLLMVATHLATWEDPQQIAGLTEMNIEWIWFFELRYFEVAYFIKIYYR